MKDIANIMEIQDFSFTYPKTETPSLNKINLPIKENHITALIGPSGCGKSTLLRAMNRIHDLYPGCTYEGAIKLKNRDQSVSDILNIKKENEFIALRQRVGMIFQKPTPFPMTIYENIAYGLRIAGTKNKADIDNIIEQSLRDAVLWDEVKDRLHKDARGLSGGQQQRLCITRVVALKPDLMLFDEPTSALDPISTLAIEEMLFGLKEKYSIAIVTHNMQQAARISDYTAFMYLGDLIEFNSTDKMFTNPKERQTENYITGKFG
ncbi:phosphate ABC transporter ATP-binding protein PstB [Thiomicrorhabdus sp.]|uniref:phosphate ABC transporter ATP-binding protein PstB n=1 Tax=Thiomicrorhabdus sp. TaxID=2039724 RepID=UPI002AA9475A|nr:phosphate ABC transporter ATP-binding protein PstB [Thiomicrorhabdus sp.]